MNCSRCQHENPRNAKFCEECGAALSASCPQCGAELSLATKFCSQCGNPVSSASGREASTNPQYTPTGPVDRKAAAHARENAAERRQLTVMFADLVGSTALAQRMDPEQLRELMQAYQAMCREQVERYGGHVAQYLGDGVMAYFGWPVADENDAERAVHAALGVIGAIKTIQAGELLAVRVGIATGPVVVGQTSSANPSDVKLAVGETPNLAARLQSLAGEDEVVIASASRRLLGATFEYQDLGDHLLKGIVEPVHAWRVLGLGHSEGRFEAAHHGVVTPLVGRSSELGLLLDLWQRARAGEGQAVLLCAEAGVGKSRIGRALRECVEHETHVRLRCQCSPLHTDSAFHPMIEQFERAAGFVRDDTPERKLDKMEALLRDGAEDISEIAPLFAAMLSLPTQRYPALDLSPQQHNERTMHAAAAHVLGLARKQPVLFIMEDAHWADPTTLETLSILLESIEAARVFVIVTYRPEFTPPWSGQPQVTALALPRLARREVAELAHRVSGKPLPPEVLEQIVAKTDGVPLFVEELTKAVLESGLLKDAGDQYRLAAPLPPFGIPSTLHDSLMARLDRLAPVKDVVQIGAVIGREFSHRLIAAVSPLSARELEAALDKLIASELVFRRGHPPDAAYVFKHALVQDAAYGSVLKSRRQQIHATIAQIIEEKFTDVAKAAPELLGMHFERAGSSQQALTWYLRAGNLAKARGASLEGIQHFQRALALCEQVTNSDERQSTEIDVRANLGVLYTTVQGWTSEAAQAHFDRARSIGDPSQYREQRFPALVGLVESLTWQMRIAEANELAEELVHFARSSQERVHMLYAWQVHSRSMTYSGRFRLALTEAQRVMEIYNQITDARLAFTYGYDPGVFALASIAYLYRELGYLDKAVEFTDQCVALARKIGHPFTLGFALSAPGADISYLMRQPERAIMFAEEGKTVAERGGFLHQVATCELHYGWAVAALGDYDQGLSHASRAIDHFKKLGVLAVMAPRMFAELALVYGMAGRADEGIAVLATSPDRVPGRKRVRYPEIYRIEGELHLKKRESDAALAEECYREAIQIAIEDEAANAQLRACTSLAKFWLTQGRIDQARALLTPVYERFTEGFGMADLIEARELLDTIANT